MTISAAAKAAQDDARRPTGQFGEQGKDEPAPILLLGDDVERLVEKFGSATVALAALDGQLSRVEESDLDELERRANLRGAPLHLHVQLQYWRGDYATDAGPMEAIDIGPLLTGMSDVERADLLGRVHSGGDVDDLYLDACRAGLADQHDGPFYAYTDDDLEHWLAENPPELAWTPDGVTPHPTGGYVVVEDTTVNGRKVREYRNAAGRLHRTDGPAFVTTDDGEQLWKKHIEQWRVDGELHCETGPAFIMEDEGEVKRTWMVAGELVASETRTISRGWAVGADGVPARV